MLFIFRYIRWLTMLMLAFLLLLAKNFAQQNDKDEVIIKNADSIILVKSKTTNTYDQRLIGNVILIHESTKIFCDSAIKYDAKNVVEAFSDVHILQGDTIHLNSQYVNYSGQERLVKARDSVELTDQQIKLYTNALDYNLVTNISYYENGGRIVNQENILTSKRGIYEANKHDFTCYENVKIVNPDYTINADSIKYNTDTRITYLIGPTTIVSDSVTIYAEGGLHNTETDISIFTKNVKINQPSYILTGDSLFYDKNNDTGEVFYNATFIDTTNNLIVLGHYMFTNEKENITIITDSVLLVQISEGDSIFTHSDTIRVNKDSLGNNVVNAYYHVKFYHKNLQGRCDSMIYTFSDSILRMFKDPVVWSVENQLTADSISLLWVNNKARFVFLNQNAFIISQEDSTKYNQLKGRNMKGIIDSNKLKIIYVFGNGESLYYPKNENNYIGINRVRSSNIRIDLKNQKVHQITFTKRPDGILHPLSDIDKIETRLRGFKWLNRHRPRKKEDVFIWKDYIPENKKKKREVIKSQLSTP